MGLDMYLKARKYVSGYSFADEKEQGTYSKLLEISGFAPGEIQKHTPSGYIELTVAYWRKANQIHTWFVKNAQNGTDDCGDYHVEEEQLVELRDLCQRIIDNPNKAEALLPTQSGFFFGDTQYGEYYFQDLKETVKQLNSILNNPKFEDWNFYYQSSW